MEKLFNSIDSSQLWEQRKSEIEARVNELLNNYPNYDSLVPLIKEISQEALWNTYSPEKKQDIINSEEKIKQHSVFLNTLPEFRYALETIHRSTKYNEDATNELLSHENAHMNVAEIEGLKGIGYSITPYKRPSGFKGYWAMAWVEKPPSDWTEEKIKDVYTKINEAPIIYDESGKLSQFDKNAIEKLN